MLPAYAARFGTVEAHSTHRRMPTAAALERWAKQVPDGFRFALKAHVGITHRRDTDGLTERTTAFLDALRPLGDRAGPVLFNLPHRQPDLPRLDLILAGLARSSLPAVFELHPGWHVPDVEDRLAAAGASLVVVDRDGDDEAGPAPERPFTYVRLRRATYSGQDLDAWATRLWGAAGDVYVYLKHDDDANGPRYALDLVSRLEQV
jgi:uncharacterized protein YecE (DUF72 family)